MDLPIDYYPFPSEVNVPPAAEVAFRKSKLSPATNCNLMFMFVQGVDYKYITRFKEADGIADDREAARGLDLSNSEISIQSVRNIFNSWRQTIFGNPKYLQDILRVLLYNSGAVSAGQYDYGPAVNLLVQYAKELNDETITKIRFQQLRACLWDCPRGLNIAEHKAKYGGHTNYVTVIREWMTIMGFDESSDFADWKTATESRNQLFERETRAKTEERKFCKSCSSEFMKALGSRDIQSVLLYLGRFRFTTEPQLFYNLVSAFIFAVIRADFMHYVDILYVNSQRKGMLSPEQLAHFESSIGYPHHAYQNLINQVSVTMIEILAHEVLTSD